LGESSRDDRRRPGRGDPARREVVLGRILGVLGGSGFGRGFVARRFFLLFVTRRSISRAPVVGSGRLGLCHAPRDLVFVRRDLRLGAVVSIRELLVFLRSCKFQRVARLGRYGDRG
jgi:hypothetical protein